MVLDVVAATVVRLRQLVEGDWVAVHGWASREDACRIQAWAEYAGADPGVCGCVRGSVAILAAVALPRQQS